MIISVKQYDYDFDPTTATWDAPAPGDTTAGGSTNGIDFGSEDLGNLQNTGGDGSLAFMLPTSTNLENAIQTALQNKSYFNLVLNSNLPYRSKLVLGRVSTTYDTPVTLKLWFAAPLGTVLLIR